MNRLSGKVQFPAVFVPGQRLVIPASHHVKDSLVVIVKKQLEFRDHKEFYDYCQFNQEGLEFQILQRVH